jgi:hypothetical protein
MFLNQSAANAFAAIAAEKAVNAELRTTIARLQTHCDWLMAHVNELKLERAQLYERIGVYVPVPTIAHSPQPDVPTDGTMLPRGRVADMGDLMQKAREIKMEHERTRAAKAEGNVPMDELSEMDIFNDVGDDAAKKLRIVRDANGEVTNP